MAFVDTPCPDLGRVAGLWAIELPSGPVRLHGGEESAAYRVGSYVVRVGAAWRSTERLEWSNGVAEVASRSVPEVVAPVRTPSGTTVERLDGRPVTLWPFVEGEWPDEDEHFEAAAELLARVHRALAAVHVEEPPAGDVPLAPAADLDDAELDEWLSAFAAENRDVHAQHGDYYHGNLLAHGGRLVALVDWDDAFVGSPKVGLANAAWEWGDGLWSNDLDDVFAFGDLYVAAGGTSPALSEVELRQLVRARLRSEIRYSRLHNPDEEYEARQRLVYDRLRV